MGKFDEMAEGCLGMLQQLLGNIHHEHPKTEAAKIIAHYLRSAATVPPGHVRVGTEDMRHIGPLLITADRVLTSPGEWVYTDGTARFMVLEVGTIALSRRNKEDTGWEDTPVSDCYSTQAAALAAKGGG